MNVERATINNIEYNLVVDFPVGVHLYDSNWKYQSTFNKVSLQYAIVANGYYYFTDSGNNNRIIKTTLISPTVLNSFGSGYRGLYYDSIGSRIVAAGCDVCAVHTLDLNLNLLSAVSCPCQCPVGVTVYNSKIYVAMYHSVNVIVISNGTIENSYSTQCYGSLARISVDSFGYLALSCNGNGQVYLYDSNMKYTNKSIGFVDGWDARLDTNNRLAICGVTNVAIYSY
jgi:hypothetical protein